LLPQFRPLPPRRERGLLSPFACGFGKVVTNYSAPSTTPGTSITPGTSDAMGSFTEFISDTLVTDDCYGIWLNFTQAMPAHKPGRYWLISGLILPAALRTASSSRI